MARGATSRHGEIISLGRSDVVAEIRAETGVEVMEAVIS